MTIKKLDLELGLEQVDDDWTWPNVHIEKECFYRVSNLDLGLEKLVFFDDDWKMFNFNTL